MISALALVLIVPLLMGLFSILYFSSLELFRGDAFVALLSVSAVLFLMLLCAVKRKVLSFSWPAIYKEENNKLLAVFFMISVAALLTFIFISLRQPNGGWDAWAIWNMRARFIYRAGEHWHDAFTPLLGWSHPDYPLLLPLSVAFIWKAFGQETAAAPVIVAATFTFATVALLWSSVTLLRGRGQGFLAGVALLGAPFFIRLGASQYADVPIGFFFLATIVLFALYERAPGVSHWLLIFAGLAAGLAAWTKNEGLLFCLAAIFARLLVIIPARGMKIALCETALFFCGLIVPLATVYFFKSHIAPPSDLFGSQDPTPLIEKLAHTSRYTLIVKEYLQTATKFTNGLVGAPLLLVYFLLMGKDSENKHGVSARTALYVVLLMLAGYFFVYVTTPQDLQWHLSKSLNRLYIQLWPSFLFWLFLKVQGPDGEATASSLRSLTAYKAIDEVGGNVLS